MADTLVSSDNRVTQWADDEFYEYVRMNPLKSLMGTSENSAFQVKEDLTKEAGDSITISLVTRLTGDGVSDDDTLHGNEESLGNYGYKITVHQQRNGVIVGQFEKIKTKIDLLNAAKTMLRLWNMEKLRDLFIERMLSPNVDGLTTYDASTEAQKDAWEAANNPTDANQRILFGAAKANSTLDHSAGLTTVDGTADDMHQDIVRLIKRMAMSADPHIRPLITGGDEPGKERFILLMGSLPFRDLEANFESVLQYADVRGDANNLFAAGDLRIGNVICKEIPEFDRTTADGGTLMSGVGAGGTTDVEACFLLGAQAVGIAWAQRMQAKMDEWDYQNQRGVAVSEIRGAGKITYNQFQHGQATVYVSAVGD